MRLVPVFILEEFKRLGKNACQTNYASLLAVFVLETCNASFISLFNSPRKKTGERRIIRLDELNRLSNSHENAIQIFFKLGTIDIHTQYI